MLIDIFCEEGRASPIEICVEERQIPNLDSELFYGYGILFAKVSRILFGSDPININCGGNIDEYDPEAHDIIARLQDNRACRPTTDICRSVFERWFTLELASEFEGYDLLAVEIDAAWKKFKGRNFVYGPKSF
jgi:hypothetical protein